MMQAKAWTILGLVATVATAALSPMAAMADQSSRQKNKNQWRNLGIAGGAVAGYGLLKHNNTATLLGAAGAAYSAKRYEDDRHSQSQSQARRDQRARYHRTHRYHRHYR
jgi:hypothetical protein